MQGKHILLGLIALGIGLVSLYIYFQYRVPEGIEPMSDSANTIAWVSLATAVVGLLTGVVSLVKAVIEMRAKRN